MGADTTDDHTTDADLADADVTDTNAMDSGADAMHSDDDMTDADLTDGNMTDTHVMDSGGTGTMSSGSDTGAIGLDTAMMDVDAGAIDSDAGAMDLDAGAIDLDVGAMDSDASAMDPDTDATDSDAGVVDSADTVEANMMDADVSASAIIINQFPFGRPGAPIVGPHQASALNGSSSVVNGDSEWSLFCSQIDWEVARWAKTCGVMSSAVGELLAIPGVSPPSIPLDAGLMHRPRLLMHSDFHTELQNN
jgi:hypothetical protein